MARRRRGERRISTTETRKYLLRQRKERRERQLLLSVLGPVLVVVLGIIGFGIYRELYMRPRTPVARVDGETITASQFAKRIQWQRPQLINNLRSFVQLAQTSDASFLTQLANSQRDNLPQTTLDQLIDEVLIRHEAASRGITVTEEDIDQRIVNDLSTIIAPPPPELSEVEGANLTATAAVTVTATPIPTEAIGRTFRNTVQQILDNQANLTTADYRDIVRQLVYREKLKEALAQEIPTKEKQVLVSFLRFSSQETAQRAADALAAGTSWEEVVARFRPPEAETEGEAAEGTASGGQPTAPADAAGRAEPGPEVTATREISPTATVTATATPAVSPTPSATPTPAPTATPNPFATSVGEPRWMTRQAIKTSWSFGDGEADEVMDLEPGSASGVIQVGGATYYVVSVHDVDPERELEPDELERRRESALEDWLAKRRQEAQIDKFPLEGAIPPEPSWFVESFRRIVGVPEPTVDLNTLSQEATIDIRGLQVSTVPPVSGGGEGQPAATSPAGEGRP